MRALFAAALLLVPMWSLGQQPKAGILVDFTGDDQVGTLFNYNLKELIRASSRFDLIESPSSNYRPRIILNIVSLDNSFGNQTGISAAISTSIVFDSADVPFRGLYLTSYVQTCGRTKTRDCAESLVAQVDRVVDSLKTQALVYWRALYGLPAQGATVSPTANSGSPTTNPRTGSRPKPKPQPVPNPF
jgi:hypothetical protein